MPTRTLIDLDPSSPGLDHHRAGGEPLFGTAMGVAAMIGAAAGAMPDAVSLTSIGVYEPYILQDAGPHRIAVELDPAAADPLGPFVAARVIRAHPALPEMLLFDARFRDSAMPTIHQPAPAGLDADGVTKDEVYRVFFPGPAFQVIAAARLHGKTLVSRLTEGPHLVPTQVRLIEFAMQSAGLLELATTGRRMIPHRLGRLGPILGDTATAAPLYATARYAGEDQAITVHVTDAAGAPVMALGDYETVELPFPANPTTAAVMTDRLRASAA